VLAGATDGVFEEDGADALVAGARLDDQLID
jgi:hypothetical protein